MPQRAPSKRPAPPAVLSQLSKIIYSGLHMRNRLKEMTNGYITVMTQVPTNYPSLMRMIRAQFPFGGLFLTYITSVISDSTFTFIKFKGYPKISTQVSIFGYSFMLLLVVTSPHSLVHFGIFFMPKIVLMQIAFLCAILGLTSYVYKGRTTSLTYTSSWCEGVGHTL
jgi:hypothetical protein